MLSKMEARHVLHKIIDRMREIACFTVLIYGSPELGGLTHDGLSIELHEKATIKHNGTHKKS